MLGGRSKLEGTWGQGEWRRLAKKKIDERPIAA